MIVVKRPQVVEVVHNGVPSTNQQLEREWGSEWFFCSYLKSPPKGERAL